MVPNYSPIYNNASRTTSNDDDTQSQLLIQYIGQFLTTENNIRNLTEESREIHNNIYNLLVSGRRNPRFSQNLLVIQELLLTPYNNPDEFSYSNSETQTRPVRQYRPSNIFSPAPIHSTERPSPTNLLFLNRVRTGTRHNDNVNNQNDNVNNQNDNVSAELIAEFLNSSVSVRPSREELTRASVVERFSAIASPLNHRCPISLDVFNTNDMVVRLMECGHLFSPNSFSEWFRNHVHCPVCRNDIRAINTSPMPMPGSETEPDILSQPQNINTENDANNVSSTNNNSNSQINTGEMEQIVNDINDISNLMQRTVGRRHGNSEFQWRG